MREFAARVHEVSVGGTLVMPPVVNVPMATVQQWINEANHAGYELMMRNRATIAAYYASPALRPPTQQEREAYEMEASRGMSREAWAATGITAATIASGMELTWTARRSRQMVDGPSQRDQHVQTMRALFDPASPVMQGGPTVVHLAAFRAINPLFGPGADDQRTMTPDAAMCYLRMFYCVAHPQWTANLGDISLAITRVVDALLDEFGDERILLDHLSGVRPYPHIEESIRCAIRRHGAQVFAPEAVQAMVDDAVADGNAEEFNRQLLQRLFDPQSPLLPAGPGPEHLAAFRALNPVWVDRPEAQSFLHMLYANVHRGRAGFVLSPVARNLLAEQHMGEAPNPIYFRRTVDHITHVRRDELIELTIQGLANAAHDNAVIMRELPMEGPFDVVQLEQRRAFRAEDLQRLVNEWERDVSEAGQAKRKTELARFIEGMAHDMDRGAAAYRMWLTHPDWLSIGDALDFCRSDESKMGVTHCWIETTKPTRAALLSCLERIPKSVYTNATKFALEHAPSTSMHRWPCADDTLFVSRLVELAPDTVSYHSILTKVFCSMIPTVPLTAPPLDDLDWDRFYQPIMAQMRDGVTTYAMKLVVEHATWRVSPRLLQRMADELPYPGDLMHSANERAAQLVLDLSRHAASQRQRQERMVAPKPDAPLAINQQLVQLDALQSCITKPNASSDEITVALGNIRELVGRISQGVSKDSACVVCMERERRVRYDPCGHMVACNECSAKSLAAKNGQCIICRAVVESTQAVFM